MDEPPVVEPVAAGDPAVRVLVEASTAELARQGYTPEQTFGYSLAQLEQRGVHLVGARVAGVLVGIGGLERSDERTGELKRFFVVPAHRGTGVADALLAALVVHARALGLERLRLETGDAQHAAIAFYRRHGFVGIPRFGPYVDSTTSVCLQRDLD